MMDKSRYTFGRKFPSSNGISCKKSLSYIQSLGTISKHLLSSKPSLLKTIRSSIYVKIIKERVKIKLYIRLLEVVPLFDFDKISTLLIILTYPLLSLVPIITMRLFLKWKNKMIPLGGGPFHSFILFFVYPLRRGFYIEGKY